MQGCAGARRTLAACGTPGTRGTTFVTRSPAVATREAGPLPSVSPALLSLQDGRLHQRRHLPGRLQEGPSLSVALHRPCKTRLHWHAAPFPRAPSVTSSPASAVLTPPAGDGSDAGQREILSNTTLHFQGAVQPELRLPALRLLSVEVSIGWESELILVRGAATPTCTRTATGGTGWDTVSRPSSRSQLTRPRQMLTPPPASATPAGRPGAPFLPLISLHKTRWGEGARLFPCSSPLHFSCERQRAFPLAQPARPRLQVARIPSTT